MRGSIKGAVDRHRSVAIALLAQLLQNGAALMLMPFIVAKLPTVEVGIWYVFVAVQSLASLADLGFQPTIARGFASAYAGANEIQTEGLSAAEIAGSPNAVLILQILRAAKVLYAGLSGIVWLVLLTIGSLYIMHLARHQGDADSILVAWVFFATSVAANIYFLWVDPLLIGAGRIAQNYVIIIINRGSFSLIGIAAIIAGGGLIALAAANFFAIVLARLIAVFWIRGLTRQLGKVPLSAHSLYTTLKALSPNAIRMGLVALGAFLITRFSVLVISSYNGLAASASYSVAIQVFGALSAAGMLPMQVALPQLVSYRIDGNLARLRNSFLWRQGFLIVFFAIAALLFVIFGQTLLNLIGSNVTLLPRWLLSLLAITVLLEINHASCSFVIATGNTIPFVASALISGVGVAGCSLAFEILGFGVTGVIAAQGLVQLAYNNWKWPLALWKELNP